jgi:hypothetical protein
MYMLTTTPCFAMLVSTTARSPGVVTLPAESVVGLQDGFTTVVNVWFDVISVEGVYSRLSHF